MHHIVAAVPTQHWYTNGTVIGITGVAVGLVAIVVAIVLWRFGTPRGLLEYSMPVSKALVSRSPGFDLQVTLGGNVVEDPYLVTLRIANGGRRDIRSSDFDQGHPLVFNLGAKVLDVLSSSSSEKQLFGFGDDDQMRLFPLLIRRSQQIIVDVLTDGKPTLSCTAELADVNVRMQSNSDPTTSSALFAGLTLVAAIVVFGAGYSILPSVIHFFGIVFLVVMSSFFIWNNYGLLRKVFSLRRRSVIR